jgi:hypothetical protein
MQNPTFDFIKKVAEQSGETAEPATLPTDTPPATNEQPAPPATETPAETPPAKTATFAPPPPPPPINSEQPTAPPTAPRVTEAQAESYAKMYTNLINFCTSFFAGFFTGNPSNKYEADKESKQQVQDAAKEYFLVSNIAVTPGFYMFVTTATVFGMITVRAFLDYKAKKLDEKKEAARLARIEAERQAAEIRQRQEQARAAALTAQMPIIDNKTQTPQTPPQPPMHTIETSGAEMIQTPPELVNKIHPKTEAMKNATTETPPAAPAKKIKTSIADVDKVIKEDIETLPEVIKDRRCFEIDAEGFYLLGERREYYNAKTKSEKYKPSAFVVSLIERAQEHTDDQRIINKNVRQRLDMLKKELGIETPPPPPAKKQKAQYTH